MSSEDRRKRRATFTRPSVLEQRVFTEAMRMRQEVFALYRLLEDPIPGWDSWTEDVNGKVAHIEAIWSRVKRLAEAFPG